MRDTEPHPGLPGAPPTGLDRLRDDYLEMVDAVLHGDGPPRVAELAAGVAGSPVVIVVPRRRLVATGGGVDPAVAEAMLDYVAELVAGRSADPPGEVILEVPVVSGGETVGTVALLDASCTPAPDAADGLHLAALAVLTQIAVDDAKEEVEERLRGSFLEELRTRANLDASEIVRRAARFGCPLEAGVVALCIEPDHDRPLHLRAIILDAEPRALVQRLDERTAVVLPARAGEDAAAGVMQRARRIADRLRRHGAVGLSAFYEDPGQLPRALREAELVVDVLRRGDVGTSEQLGSGTYRLLMRVLATHPDELRAFFQATVAPIAVYDDRYRTDLVGTLEAYLGHNCNMNATASAVYAHRHTIAYRLERVKELTGLDPGLSEDRERLGLGLKVLRLLDPPADAG